MENIELAQNVAAIWFIVYFGASLLIGAWKLGREVSK